MVGDNFTYNNRSLSDFNFVMMKPESEDSTGLSREILKGNTNAHRKEAIHFGTKYTDVLVINLFIVKDDEVFDDLTMSYDEIRTIESWLTNNSTPETLKIISNDNPSIEYYGIFTNITPFVVNGLNGLYLTFTNTSPFAYERNAIYFTNSQSDFKRNFNCTSDENDYVYPIIKITPTFAESETSAIYSVKNKRENRTMQFTLTDDYEEYIIDCKLKRIVADGNVLTMSDIGWNIQNIINTASNQNNEVALGTISLYWLRFLPGVNQLEINGSGNYEISCKSPVKLGGLPYA